MRGGFCGDPLGSLIDFSYGTPLILGRRGRVLAEFDETSTLKRPRPQGGAGKSPFRYPGGKAFLLPELHRAIQSCDSKITQYAEPFAGGAGAAIELLAAKVVKKIHLNDADPRIYSAWYAMLHRNDEFKRRLFETPLTMDTWRECQQIVSEPKSHPDELDLGFATFFLNRTNRSGIVIGGGPIGGHGQNAKWNIDARYYLDTMLTRIHWIGEQAKRISVSNLDAVDFIKEFDSRRANNTFFFIDPPYVKAGSRLYLNTMDEAKHRNLAESIRRKKSMRHWFMTYDDHKLIREVYADSAIAEFPVRYSLQKKRLEKEIRITPN